jgi:hypothetical protein
MAYVVGLVLSITQDMLQQRIMGYVVLQLATASHTQVTSAAVLVLGSSAGCLSPGCHTLSHTVPADAVLLPCCLQCAVSCAVQ